MTARTLFRLSCCGHDWTAREGFRTITSVCVRVKIPAAEREVQLSGAIGLPAFRRTVLSMIVYQLLLFVVILALICKIMHILLLFVVIIV